MIIARGAGFGWADDGSGDAVADALASFDAAVAAAREQLVAASGRGAPVGLREWAERTVSLLPMADDDFEPLAGVRLGDLRRWVA